MSTYREAIVCYFEKDGDNLDVVYEDITKWEVRNGALILYHGKDGDTKSVTVVPFKSFESCDIREYQEEDEKEDD